jgi:WD40-like Beta Propeller Repeat
MHLAFGISSTSKGTHLYVVGVRNRDLRHVGNGILPAWSPDGGTIAFSRGSCFGIVAADGSSDEPFCSASIVSCSSRLGRLIASVA